MNPNGPWPQTWRAPTGNRFDVNPTAHRGTLNYGLTRRHALMGVFPTAESVKELEAGRPPRHEVGAVGGMQRGAVSVTELKAGTTLYRFGPAGNGHKGGWWTSRDGLFRMLLRVEPRVDGMPGVHGGSELNLRDYARKYSEVLSDWSDMKFIYGTRLLGNVVAFCGMGAAQATAPLEIHDAHGNIVGMVAEKMSDDNRQILIPNIYARIDGPPPREPRFFSPVVRMHPEAVEAKLVPAIRRRLANGDRYRNIIPDVEAWMMRGRWREPLNGDPAGDPGSGWSADAID
ncbi:MAG: hypothetical protein ACI9OJ_005925 [Myxococcota bacterium]|jgi:hypothetical protein